MADWCAVDQFDEDGDSHPVAFAHVDASKLELAVRLREHAPDDLDPNHGRGLVLH
jgi:hypothetical protein